MNQDQLRMFQASEGPIDGNDLKFQFKVVVITEFQSGFNLEHLPKIKKVLNDTDFLEKSSKFDVFWCGYTWIVGEPLDIKNTKFTLQFQIRLAANRSGQIGIKSLFLQHDVILVQLGTRMIGMLRSLNLLQSKGHCISI